MAADRRNRPSEKRQTAAQRPSEKPAAQGKGRVIAFTPAFKSGLLWMAAAFLLPLLLWTLFTAATFAGLIPVYRPNFGWAAAWLFIALPCLLNAARRFNWRGFDKLAWLISALAGFAILTLPAALLVYFTLAQWMGVKL